MIPIMVCSDNCHQFQGLFFREISTHLNLNPTIMKISSTKSPAMLIIIAAIGYAGYLASCTQNDQILLTDPSAVNTTDLVSVKATTPPDIDGNIDAVWANAKKLDAVPQVPDPGNGLFAGYIGTQYPMTIRSMYDDTYIYFLAEWADANKSVQVAPWYFNPTTKRWAQEPTAMTFDVNGVITRDGWGEDKLAFLWNIDNSTAKFAAQTCYASCHIFTPYLDVSVTPNVMKPNQSGNHYTNGANEKIDMWWLKIGRDPLFNQFSDEYQDWAGGPAFSSLVGGSANGRHQDDQTVTGTPSATYPYGPTYTSNVAGTGTSNNTQTKTITGTATSVSIPKYVIPDKTDYYYILQSEVDAGTAKLVTAVDINGVLTLSDNSTIDPNVGTDYQRVGDAVYGGDGPKIIPSYISAALTNGRADISCQAVYTGAGWIVEWKRLLKTPGTLKQDIDFSSLADQPFGVAIFNKSNYQHGIKPNLMLKFEKP